MWSHILALRPCFISRKYMLRKGVIALRLNQTSTKSANTVVDSTNLNSDKNVVLYQFDNRKNCKVANTFAFYQLSFCYFLSFILFPGTLTSGAPVEVCLLLVIFGNMVGMAGLIPSRRSVSQLILLEGGQQLDITTYSTLLKPRSLTVSVRQVEFRSPSSVGTQKYLPMKVKGVVFPFRINLPGDFQHHRLLNFTDQATKAWSTFQ